MWQENQMKAEFERARQKQETSPLGADYLQVSVKSKTELA